MVCARRGWRLARIIGGGEKARLCWAMRKAKIAAAWVGSVDGYEAGPCKAVLLEVKACGNELKQAVICEQPCVKKQRLQKRAYKQDEYCSDPIDNYVEKKHHGKKKRTTKDSVDPHHHGKEKRRHHHGHYSVHEHQPESLTPTVLQKSLSATMTPMTMSTPSSGTRTTKTNTSSNLKPKKHAKKPVKKQVRTKKSSHRHAKPVKPVKSSTTHTTTTSVTKPGNVRYKPAKVDSSFHVPSFVEPHGGMMAMTSGRKAKKGHRRGSSRTSAPSATSGANDDLLSVSVSASISASLSASAKSESASVEFSSSLDEYIGGRHSFIHRFGRGARPADIEKQAKGTKCIDGVQPIRRHRRRHFAKHVERSSESLSVSASLSVDASVDLPLLTAAAAAGAGKLKAAERPIRGVAATWPAPNNIKPLAAPNIKQTATVVEVKDAAPAKDAVTVEPIREVVVEKVTEEVTKEVAQPAAGLDQRISQLEGLIGRLTQLIGRGNSFSELASSGESQFQALNSDQQQQQQQQKQ